MHLNEFFIFKKNDIGEEFKRDKVASYTVPCFLSSLFDY